MKVLKWILLAAFAAATAGAVVYAVLRRADECRDIVFGLFDKGKAVVLPCYERVLAFFTENDFVDAVEEIAD